MVRRTLRLNRSNLDKSINNEDSEVDNKSPINNTSSKTKRVSFSNMDAESENGIKDKEDSNDEGIGAGNEDTTDDEGGVDTPPPEEEIQNDEERQPEEIIDMEVLPRRKCPIKFRVRWSGLTEKEDTWEYDSKLNRIDLVSDFLEISGRKPEYEKALAAKKKEIEENEQNIRKGSRRNNHYISYSELDDDDEIYVGGGTRTRKSKLSSFNEYKPAPPKKKIKKDTGNYEVSAIVDHRVRGRFTEYKVSWKGFSSKFDKWLPESNLSGCSKMIEDYIGHMTDREEEYEVESIQHMRIKNGVTEYKVRWKGWGPKYDSWLPEDEMNCPEILNKFNEILDKLEKQEDWQVEKILDHRERKGTVEYLIHWLGFEDKYNSWEPVENVEGCQDLLDKYHQKIEKKKKKILKEGRQMRTEREKPERFSENYQDVRARGPRRNKRAISYNEENYDLED